MLVTSLLFRVERHLRGLPHPLLPPHASPPPCLLACLQGYSAQDGRTGGLGSGGPGASGSSVGLGLIGGGGPNSSVIPSTSLTEDSVVTARKVGVTHGCDTDVSSFHFRPAPVTPGHAVRTHQLRGRDSV